MKVLSIGKENKFIVSETFSSDGFQAVGKVGFRWGKVAVPDDFVLTWGEERMRQTPMPCRGSLHGASHNTKGIFIFLKTGISGTDFYYAFQEKEKNENTGKQPGDFSVVAESREPGETDDALFDRALREEANLNTQLVTVDRRIGYYALDTPSGVIWVHAVVGSVDPAVLYAVHVGSNDGQTYGECWMPPQVLLGTSVRDGIQSMMADIHAGRAGIIHVGSKTVRETEVIFDYYGGAPRGGVSVYAA